MTRRDEQIHRGFDAGNYANAYETTCLDKAIGSLSTNRSDAYVAAFTLGFLADRERSELGSYEETYDEAFRLVGKRARQLGIAVDHKPDFGGPDSENHHTCMTFGVLPDRELFDGAFKARCPDGVFTIGNAPELEDLGYSRSDSFDCDGLWALLEECMHVHDTDPDTGDGGRVDTIGSFASCILGTLGFEWI